MALTEKQKKARRQRKAAAQNQASSQTTYDQQLAELAAAREASGTSNQQLNFIGGMPGGVAYNPVTGQRVIDPTTGRPAYVGTQGRPGPVSPYVDPSAFNLAYDPSFTAQYPHYLEGDEYDLINISSDPDRYIKLQQQMLAAGLYDNNARIASGVVGPDDVQAYYRLLAQANINYSDADSTLNNLLVHPVTATPKKRDPLVITLSNNDDIKQVTKQAISDLYGGGNLDPDTLQQVIDSVHGTETGLQTQKYNLGGGEATQGGSVAGSVEEGNLSQAAQYSRAEEILKQKDPEQVTATRFGNAMKNVLATLSEGVLHG